MKIILFLLITSIIYIYGWKNLLNSYKVKFDDSPNDRIKFISMIMVIPITIMYIAFIASLIRYGYVQ
jgi:hypothetical protein